MTRIPRSALAGMLALLLALASVWPSTMAAAQRQAREPVVVAVPDIFPDLQPRQDLRTSVRAVILRYPPGRGRDVILLKPDDASPETLGAAIHLLRRLRSQEPHPRAAQVSMLTGFAPGPNVTQASLRGLAAKLQELQREPTVRIGSFGPGRWIELADATFRP